MSVVAGFVVALVQSVFALLGLAQLGPVPPSPSLFTIQQAGPIVPQGIPQQTSSSSVSSSPSNVGPVIDITNISGDTITVQYNGLSTTYEGPTPPSSLWIQSTPWSNPIDEVAINGAPSGKITFRLPANIPPGDYTVIPVGIPTTSPVGGKAPGPVSYGAVASFNVSSDGSVKIAR